MFLKLKKKSQYNMIDNNEDPSLQCDGIHYGCKMFYNKCPRACIINLITAVINFGAW
jgi:hypothetical protein